MSLKDDFALYVNKDVILTQTIPDGYPFGGTLMDTNKMLMDDTTSMFLGDAPSSHDAKLAYDLFWLMMDWDSRNTLGVTPLKQMTDRAEAIASLDDLTAYLTEVPPEEQLFSFWETTAEIDPDNATCYIPVLDMPVLLLDDSAEYSQMRSYGAIKKEARSALAQKMLTKLGYSEEEAVEKIENCLAFETRLSPSICTNLVKRGVPWKHHDWRSLRGHGRHEVYASDSGGENGI